MESLVRKGDKAKDLDDSGCVQDDESLNRRDLESQMAEDQRPSLLDLSDDVLLCILKYCSPRDLKALGFTCPRLGALILDHTLWTTVALGDDRCGMARLRWLTEHALNSGTRFLQLSGLAREAHGCLGYINRSKPIKKQEHIPDERKMENTVGDENVETSAAGTESCRKRTQTEPSHNPPYPSRQPAHLHIWASSARQLPRFTTSPYWPLEAEEENLSTPSENGCCGPVFTLTPSLLATLRTQCQLHTLHLHYVNINCAATDLAKFPKTLKSLSLRGTKCFNMSMDCSFLYKINDSLPGLEHIDVSECEWIDPAALIPLSKLPALKRLEMRYCHRLSEFIAYGSLATRYGFKHLESLDVRGSPLGESEVSPFGYVATLRELYLSSAACPSQPSGNRHAHYRDEPRGLPSELEDWERQEPEYYKPKREKSPTPEPEVLPNVPTDIPQIRPSNIFTVTLSRDSAPVIEHVAPENLHRFLISQNMIAVNVNENNGPEVIENNDVKNENEPPFKRRKTNEEGTKQNGRGCPQNGAENQDGDVKQDSEVKQDGVSTSESDGENAVPLKKRKLNGVNYGASTSKADESPKVQNFVKFRRNQPPIVVTKEDLGGSGDNLGNPPKSFKLNTSNVSNSSSSGQYTSYSSHSSSSFNISTDDDSNQPGTSKSFNSPPKVEPSTSKNTQNTPPIAEQPNTDSKPDLKVDNECVALDKDLKNAINEAVSNESKRDNDLAEENVRPVIQEVRHNRPLNLHNRIRMSYLSNLYYTPAARPIDPTTLVTDSCIKMFGVSDNDDVNYVHIGPNGAFFVGRGQEHGIKPPKSNLRKLVCNNYSGITNSSLDHLATAAPLLELIDFSGTNVTQQGVEEFKSLRPDCKVIFCEFKKG